MNQFDSIIDIDFFESKFNCNIIKCIKSKLLFLLFNLESHNLITIYYLINNGLN